MDGQEDYGNPFAIPNLWDKSCFSLSEEEITTFHLEELEGPLEHLEPPWEKLDHLDKSLLNLDYEGFQLDDIDTNPFDSADHEPLPEIADSTSSTPSLISEVGTDQDDDSGEDIWTSPDVLLSQKPSSKSGTWESFYDDEFQPARSYYISEGGPGVIDSILVSHSAEQEQVNPEHIPTLIFKSDPLFAGLFHLMIGRESEIFGYDDEHQTYHSRYGNVRMSGFCPETFQSLTASIIKFANCLKGLQNFVSDVYASRKSSRSLIAITDHISRVLLTLEAGMHQSFQNVHSVLQLQALIQKPDMLLAFFTNLIAQINSLKGDEETFSMIYRLAQDSDHSSWIRPQLLSTLHHAMTPWLSILADWLGLRSNREIPQSNDRPSFVRKVVVTMKDDRGNETTEDEFEFEFDSASLPNFATIEEGETMFDVGQGLRLLQAHIPEHPCNRKGSTAFEAPALQMQFSWQDIERVERQAKTYEADVLAAIKAFDSGEAVANPASGSDVDGSMVAVEATLAFGEAPETYLNASISQIENALPALPAGNDDGFAFLGSPQSSSPSNTNSEDATLFNPPISLIPSLSFNPIIFAQARLINQSTLRLVFKDHKLRSHLSLQHRYQLLGDGVFASRLSHALFDADIPSAERKKGNPRVGVSGLRLGSRETWPPASSELRLALMGILSDSYHSTAPAHTQRPADLPGGLSFAIRAMSETELQKCIDPNSISALDFLRLQYKPPPPLDVIISPTSLEKYDTIFRLLLRANRMLYAVNHFSRSLHVTDFLAQRFKIEAYHFVSCVCNYFFEKVTSVWNAFSGKLDALERRIERYEIGEHDRLKGVREMHDAMLDEMMFALLLRKRHEMLMGLLEEIFGLVLVFAMRERGGEQVKESFREEYARFGKKVRVFVSVCRGLSERKLGSVGGEVEGGGVDMLLLRLEMSGFYARGGG
ncbi:MAG: hypothetical protein Q9195_005503 [Heterodermia aff. obscurata]